MYFLFLCVVEKGYRDVSVCRRSQENHFRYLGKRRADVVRERNKAFPLNVVAHDNA